MVTMVLTFALITALFELLMLLKFASVPTMQKPWFGALVHIVAAGANLLVHWGTIVGTMTAVTAALVSFAVLPMAIWLKTFWKEFKNGQEFVG